MKQKPTVVKVLPDSFETPDHFYPRVLNAQMHPMVQHFLSLGNDRIADRYIHLHPEVDPEAVREVLSHSTRYFRWGGADLFPATTDDGVRRIIVIETNSCPSGQKSMPFGEDALEQSGYRTLLERTFLPMLRRRRLPKGGLAVIYDKNEMETSGYAAMLAEITGEPVWWVPCFQDDKDLPVRFTDGVMEIRTPEGAWEPIRAAFRYVTQRPWSRIPTLTRTAILNPVLVCLSGGRNKLMAAKAYDLYNAELQSTGLMIRTPETIWDVAKNEVPLWVQRMGGIAVVKDPYSNAGQGVYTLTNARELEEFMAIDFRFDRFIVQSLVGNSGWSSQTQQGRFYHLGTLPNRRKAIYVADLRMMIGVSPDSGSYPVAIYARRARKPLTPTLNETDASWDMLGTNLSIKKEDGSWGNQSERLMLMDSRDFNQLGVGLDDLIEGYLQSVLSVIAIDKLAQQLTTQKGVFRRRLFASLNPDPAFVQDISFTPSEPSPAVSSFAASLQTP